jgi:hypothetical protein
MSKSNTTEADTLAANLKGTDPSWRANANRWIALYTADPGEAGTATTNESAYGSYARVAVPIADWTGTNPLTNTNLLQFPACTSGSETITHVAIVTTASGAGQILYSGALNASRAVSAGIQPQFAPAALSCAED